MSDLPPVLPRHLEAAGIEVEAQWERDFARYWALFVRNGWNTTAEMDAERADCIARMTPLRAQVLACDERAAQREVQIRQQDAEIQRNRTALANYAHLLHMEPPPTVIPPRPDPPEFYWKRPDLGDVYWMSRSSVIHEERDCSSSVRVHDREQVTVVRSELEWVDGWRMVGNGWRHGWWVNWLEVAFADGRRRGVRPCSVCCEGRSAAVFAFPDERVGAAVTRNAWMDGDPVVPLAPR